MKKCIWVLLACVVFLSIDGVAQSKRRAPRTVPKPQESRDVAPAATFPGYSFEIEIDVDKNIHLAIQTGHEYEDLDNSQLKTALTEYLLMQAPHPRQKPIGPNVVIRPDESLDMQTILDVIRTARVSGASEVRIITPDGEELSVPPDPKFVKIPQVKPNPLLLVVSLQKDKSIDLNNEKYGSLLDVSPLTEKLKTILHQRDISGAFRPGTNEIEKTIYIQIFPGAKFSELGDIVKALVEAEAAPLFLQVDGDIGFSIQDRRPILK